MRERRDPLEDEARFLRSWFERPLVTGAVTPSGRMLARTMASYADPSVPGPVIELGPGRWRLSFASTADEVDFVRLRRV